jgi:hypothetical protein
MLTLFGEKIPLELIGNLLKAIAIPVFMVFSFMLGQLVQSDNLKWLATFEGIKNPVTGEFLGCKPMLNETSSTLSYYWDCRNETRGTDGLAANTSNAP